MRARAVSAPTRSAVIVKEPEPFTVPPVTGSPGSFRTGAGSPVSIDSSTWEEPPATAPSTGTAAPGTTRSTSPTRTAVSGTSSSVPSADTRRATAGARSISARIASPVRRVARRSNTCPSSTRATMVTAASK